MKRIIAWLLTLCIMLSVISSGGFSIAFGATVSGLENTDYADLFDSTKANFANTMLINPSWSLTTAVEGSTDLTIVFRGIEITEKYDASRHFSSFSAAWTAWEAKHTTTSLQKTFATTVPNFVLAAGTYTENIKVVGSANIYGAYAGITPNDPTFDVSNALPTDVWAANPARTGATGETIVTGGITRSNYVGTSTTNTKYSSVYSSAGVNAYNVVIDGITFKTKGFNQKDIVSSYRTSTVNVYNTIFDAVDIGLSAAGDKSTNFNDYNVKNARVSGMTGRFVYMYPRVVNIEGMAYQNNTARFYNGGSQSNVNDLWWKNKGGDRKFNFNVKNSVFAKNNVSYLFYFADNCHLNSNTMTFENNLFNDASYKAMYGTFIVFSYENAQGVPTFTAKNNTFYSSTLHHTLFNGNASYQKNMLSYTVNNNRIIGYTSPVQNLTLSMDTFLSGCSWNFDDNYLADTFTSVDDAIGRAPDYKTKSSTFDPVDFANTPYYFDYKMTTGTSTVVNVSDINFKDKVYSYSIDHGNKLVSAVLSDNTTIENVEFTTDVEGSTAKLYKSKDDKSEITTISTDNLTNGYGSYYLEITLNNLVFEYTVIVQNIAKVTPFEQYAPDADGVIKNTAVALVEGSFADESYVIRYWEGVPYRFKIGTNAFTSVKSARAKGFTQIILPEGSYSELVIDGSVEIYGVGYKSNPNDKLTDVLKTPAMSSAWADVNHSVVNKITVTADATPENATGTNIIIKGIELTGEITDATRGKSSYKTSFLLENILYTYSGKPRPINLKNENATGADGSVENIDEFIVRNSRFDFETKGTGYRMFQYIGPSRTTFDGVVFVEGFMVFGYPQWQANVKNGKYTITNCYFSRPTGTLYPMYLEGHGTVCPSEDKTTAIEISNNVYIGEDSFTELYPGAFDDITITGNTFIDPTFGLSKAVRISKKDYAPLEQNLLEKITFENNRVIGFSAYLVVEGYTVQGKLVNGNGNYYSRNVGDTGVEMYGLLKDCDYHIDYEMTTLNSSMCMVNSRENTMVNNDTRSASVIIGKTESYKSDFKTVSGDTFLFYEDEECNRHIPTLTAKEVGDGLAFYAKATNEFGVSVVYKMYATVGENLKTPDKVGTANIEAPYLFYDKTEDMPVGTKFAATWQGIDYVFTAGVNAFASVSQITNHFAQNVGEGTPNIILPSGVLNEDVVVTKSANFYGESAQTTVLTSEPDTTSAIKIACVGDSITEGIGVDASLRYKYSYPAQLQTKLDAKYGVGAYEVGNFGKGGSTIQVMSNRETDSYSFWTYIYTVQYYRSLDFNPDIVVIMMGHNDTHTAFYTTPEGYKSQYQALIDTYTSLPSNPTVVIAGCTGRKANVRQQCLTQAVIPTQQELAKENGLIFIDMYTDTIGLVNNATWFTDGLHGTEKGYGLLSDLILKGITPLLTEQPRTATKTDITVDTASRTETSGKIKVACIGDSLTYGDKSYAGYPIHLQDMLGDNYEVRNLGENGTIACDEDTHTSGTNWSYKHYARYAHSIEWKPDIVIMMLGYNDAGTHLTNYHSVNWSGGASSSAAKEFYEDYKALVKEYMDLGATVYCMGAPAPYGADLTNARNTNINTIIEKVAKELGLEYHNTFEEIVTWDYSLRCGTNKNGVTDNTHFSDEGYRKLAVYMFESLFSDFATQYVDELCEIKNSAMIVDYTADNHTDGDIVTYAWEGKNYKFVWGTNAFSSAADAVAYANNNNITSLQLLIPENKIGTTEDYAFVLDGDLSGLTSVEVFGANRKFNPNDKSATSVDSSADWSRNPNWDMYSVDGGTSAVSKIVVPVMQGTLKFKGVTLRNVVLDKDRKEGADNNLDLIFENCLVDFTKTSAKDEALFELDNKRSDGVTPSNDSLTLKNFRIEKYMFGGSVNRVFKADKNISSNFVHLDGVYYNGNLNPEHKLEMFGELKTSKANTEAEIIIENSNFRNAYTMFSVIPVSDDVVSTGKSTVYHVTDNVFCDVGAALKISAKYYTDFKVTDNIFVQSVQSPVFVNGETATDVNYASAIDYTATNNTFVLADLSDYSGITLNDVTDANLDLTGIYLAQYTDNYAKSVSGTQPLFGKCDYYYEDYARNIKKDYVPPIYTITADETVDLGKVTVGYDKITARSIKIKNSGTTTVTDITVTSDNENIIVTADIPAIKAGAEAAFEVTADTGLAAGKYEATVTVSTKQGATATVKVTFEVQSDIEEGCKKFTDVKHGSWYEEYVEYANHYGLMDGTSAKTFEPNTKLNRATFVTILAKLEGVYNTLDKNTKTDFKDVATGKWFSGAVAWAVKAGITSGTSATTFEPMADITREQMCTMLVRYANYKNISIDTTVVPKEVFKDDSKISKFAKEAVYTCQMSGIVNGLGDGKFGPKETATRAQASKIFAQFHKSYLAD